MQEMIMDASDSPMITVFHLLMDEASQFLMIYSEIQCFRETGR